MAKRVVVAVPDSADWPPSDWPNTSGARRPIDGPIFEAEPWFWAGALSSAQSRFLQGAADR